MFNPAGGIYERINSLIKLDEERGNKKEPSGTKGLLKRVSAMDNTSSISKNKDLQFIKDIIVEATTKEMKKELFKKIGVVQDA